ncbi:MAG TPA: zinc ribbon domain-containing protein [Gemmatimonadaceae bacterium]
MPTYEFTCPDGHDFDKFFRSMASAPTVVPCPVCGKSAERQMSAGAGLVFHGTGFYITDYGKDGKKDQKTAPGRKTDPKPDSAAESKPAESAGAESRSAEAKTEASSSASPASDSRSGSDAASAPSSAPVKAPASPKASE